MDRKFDEGRAAQGFRSQAHLDAFYARLDHTKSCATCLAGGSMELDDGLQPTGGACAIEKELYAASFGEKFAREPFELLAIGQRVLINGGPLAGSIIEAEKASPATVGAQPFGLYLIELDGGAIEGFTIGYLTPIRGACACGERATRRLSNGRTACDHPACAVHGHEMGASA